MRNQEILEHHLLQEKIAKLRKAREEHKKISEEDKIESYAEYSKHVNGLSKQGALEADNSMISAASSSSSSDKTESSVPVVYRNLRDEEERRPKSATEVIKQHLELERAAHKRTPIRLISNKTVPISIYGVQLPKSADEKRRQFKAQKRNLKSAGDSGLVKNEISDVLAAGDGGLHQQLFELNHYGRVGKSVVGEVDID